MQGSQLTHIVHYVNQISVAAIEFSGVAYGFMINFLCVPQDQKGLKALL